MPELTITSPYVHSRARICNRLWSPGIDSEKSIPPAYLARRAGTKNRVVVLAHQGGNRFLGPSIGLQIRAQSPESIPPHLPWATLCQSRLYPPIWVFGFGLCVAYLNAERQLWQRPVSAHICPYSWGTGALLGGKWNRLLRSPHPSPQEKNSAYRTVRGIQSPYFHTNIREARPDFINLAYLEKMQLYWFCEVWNVLFFSCSQRCKI